MCGVLKRSWTAENMTGCWFPSASEGNSDYFVWGRHWQNVSLSATSGKMTYRLGWRFRQGVILEVVATVTEIGSLISRRPDIRGGRPCIAGTGVSVRRIAQWHNMGLIPEEIARKFGHLSLAQVHAALAFRQLREAASG